MPRYAHLARDEFEPLLDVSLCLRLVLLNEDGTDELVDRVLLRQRGELL